MVDFQDYFGTPIAYDPTQDRLVAGATFTVHAVDDTALTTPLAVFEPGSGAAIAELRSSSVGVLPDFRVAGDPPQVLIKSGTFVTSLTSVYGAVLAAGLAPDQVQAAIEAGGEATAARDEATTAAGLAVAAAADAQAFAEHVPGMEPVTVATLPTLLRNNRRQNAVSFTQDPIKTTADGTQFVVWMNDAGNPVIGRRKIPASVWDVFDLSTIPGNPLAAPTVDDGHNSYSLGIDADGYLHIVGNQHSDPMHYIRSAAPLDHTAWVSVNTMTGVEEANVAYPQFVNLPSGELLFLYRAGASGMGRTYLNAYNTATQSWVRRCYILDGRTVVPTESAYTNKLAVSADGVLFIFWMWRQGIDPSTHHDLSCIKSVDGGATWTTVTGTPMTVPIQPTDTTARITATSGVNGALNQSGATVDASGRPWAAFTQDLSAQQYGFGTQAVHWDGSAWVWTTAGATGGGVELWYYISRPAVIAWGDRVFVLYVREYKDGGRTLRMAEVTPGRAVRDIALFRGRLGMYEPVFDTAAINERDELHLLVTPTAEDEAANVPDLVATWGAILTVDLTRVDALLASRTPVGEQKIIGAQQLVSVFGSPVQAVTDGRASWTLPSSGLAVVGGWVDLPSDWTSYRLEVMWAPATGDAGSVVFNGRTSSLRATNQIASQERNWGDVTVVAPGVAKSIVTTVLAPTVYTSIYPGGLFASVRRQDNASDTYPQGAVILGLLFTRLT